MTPTPDDAHFLQSLSVDLTNRGEAYFGKRCGEIAASLTAAAGVGDGPRMTWETFDRLEKKMDKIEDDTIERCAQWLELNWNDARAADAMRRALKSESKP